MSAVYACQRVIAEDLASLPLPLYRRGKTRGKTRATGHPLYTVLHDQPNPLMTSFQFRETMMLHLLSRGNAFAEIQRTNGWPSALWPIPASRVSARRRKDTGELDYYVSPRIGAPARLAARDMFHIPGLSLDGVWGISPIEMARESIGLGLAAEQFASGFFANGARPSMVLKHPGSLSQEAQNNLRAQFEATQTGLNNAQRVAILEEAMDVKELTIPPGDAQFVEQRKFSVEEIARQFRVQPFKIGHHERSTFNNIEHLSIDHVVSTIRPWAVRWEQAIRKDLIPVEEQDEYFAEFLTAGLLRGDHAARGEFYRTMWNIGALSSNDIRELENLNPTEGGDTYYVPLNMMPAGSNPAEQAQRMRLLLTLGKNGHETRTEEMAWSPS
jgi:HK97 family phage portal protein